MYKILQITLALLLLNGCGSEQNPPPLPGSGDQNAAFKALPVERDLEDILEDGKLTVITTYRSSSYFL